MGDRIALKLAKMFFNWRVLYYFVGVERDSDSEDSDSNSGSVAADETASRYMYMLFYCPENYHNY